MISYTRNFEDVILQRVFSDVEKGSYLDVGASHPIRDSNTYALYEKGWRGVAVEPLPLQKIWETLRPSDVFLNIAIGAQSGMQKLHVYRNNQISSTSAKTIEHWTQQGLHADKEIEVQMSTLDQVFAEHILNRPLHLMSVDVEGLEYDVLNGLNLDRNRPWVIVVEAVVPGTSLPAYETWEKLLLAADYSMIYFDGVNRFYLASEQDRLRDRFALPPNVWDGFVTAEQIKITQENARLRAENKRLRELLSLPPDGLDGDIKIVGISSAQ